MTGWGEKAHLSLAKILDLRRGPDGKIIKQEPTETKSDEAADQEGKPIHARSIREEDATVGIDKDPSLDASPSKRVKLEESTIADPLDDEDGGISDSDLAGLV